MGSTCTCSQSASSDTGAEDASAPAAVDAAVQLQLDASASSVEAETAQEARIKLQLSEQEWQLWEQKKEDLLEERQRMRENLKQRFEEFCERNGVGPLGGSSYPRGKAAVRWATAY